MYISYQDVSMTLSAGDFSYTEGSSGWTDSSIGSQGWVLYENATSKGTTNPTIYLLAIKKLQNIYNIGFFYVS